MSTLSLANALFYGTGIGAAFKISRLGLRTRNKGHLIIASAQNQNPSQDAEDMLSSSCLTINRTVLNGEIIDYPGTVLVKGNVKSGAVIRATGDIVVIGFLEGEAHAGRNGNECSTIFASKLKSKALSIAGYQAQNLIRGGSNVCKIAALSGDKIWIHDLNTFEFPHSKRGVHGDTSPADVQKNGCRMCFGVDLKSMKMTSKLAAFTGAYIFLVGMALFIFPEPLFGAIFDLSSSVKEWIRVGAVLAMVFGVYYIGTAWGEAKGFDGAESFYMSTVIGRVFIFLSFSWMVARGAASLPLFAVGAVNLFGALSMLNALRKSHQ